MDWYLDNDVLLPLREQELLIDHVSYDTNTVRFFALCFYSNLVYSIHLMCSSFRVYRSFIASLLSASCVRYPPDEIFYCRKKIKVLHAVLKTNRFHFYILIHTCTSTLCILSKDTVLGTLHFFNISPVSVNITTFLSPLSFFDKLSLVSLSSILPTPINITSTINSTLQDLVRLTIGHWTRNDFIAIPTRRRRVSDVSKPAIGKTRLSYIIIIGDHSSISVRPYYLTV